MKGIIMKRESSSWELFYKEGLAYGERVKSGARSGKLSPSVLHGVAAMANEKMLMALLLYHRKHPEGHTFDDLIRAVSKISDISPSLKESLIRIDDLLPLCTFDPAPQKDITPEDVKEFVTATALTRQYVDDALSDEKVT
jgi:HEPN domain-containing protein